MILLSVKEVSISKPENGLQLCAERNLTVALRSSIKRASADKTDRVILKHSVSPIVYLSVQQEHKRKGIIKIHVQ